MKPIYQELNCRLLERLDYIKITPGNILIIEKQLSNNTQQISKKFPNAKIYNDNDNNISFDLILAIIHDSNLTHFIKSFATLRDSLTADGILLFCCFAKNNISIDLHHIGDAMLDVKFQDPVVDVERFTLEDIAFEVVYGHALGIPKSKNSTNNDGSVNIPIDSIKRL